jgi:hypothetical protein
MRGHLGNSVIAAAVGAGLMFLLDPNSGRRRRALIRDKGVKLAHNTTWAFDKTSRDMRNRIHGLIVSLQGGGQSRPGRRSALFQRNWPPAIRLTMGTIGSLATAIGLAKRGLVGAIIGGTGTGLAAMAATNFSIRNLMKGDSARHETHLREAMRESRAASR